MDGFQSCCICGIGVDPTTKRRLQTRKELKDFVANFCKPTPFVFGVLARPLLACEMDERVPICIPCVNWKRRVESLGLKRVRYPMLQMDQFIMFLMQPGVFPEPDTRCLNRLIKAARQPDNRFIDVFPLPVKTIMANTASSSWKACILAWWEYNGRTHFFASGQEAKRVRRAVKRIGPGA
jgi:hypothetical protein